MNTSLSLKNIIEIADFAGIDINLKQLESWDMETQFTLTDEDMVDIKGSKAVGLKIYCTEYPEEGAVFLDAIDEGSKAP